jgi:hypothetical protein
LGSILISLNTLPVRSLHTALSVARFKVLHASVILSRTAGLNITQCTLRLRV